jgi:hypothetical protein
MSTPTMPTRQVAYNGRTDTGFASPLSRLARVLIPAGTPLRRTDPRNPLSTAGRDITIDCRTNPIRTMVGHVDVWNDYGRGRGFVILPVFTYIGSGGYYTDVQVTPELCAANGVPAPTLPTFTDYEQAQLDTLPDFGPGYDDRIVLP